MSEEVIPLETKKNIVDSEIAMYKNTRYQLELRYRVNKKIGAPTEVLKQLEQELIRIVAGLDELEKIKVELTN